MHGERKITQEIWARVTARREWDEGEERERGKGSSSVWKITSTDRDKRGRDIENLEVDGEHSHGWVRFIISWKMEGGRKGRRGVQSRGRRTQGDESEHWREGRYQKWAKRGSLKKGIREEHKLGQTSEKEKVRWERLISQERGKEESWDKWKVKKKKVWIWSKNENAVRPACLPEKAPCQTARLMNKIGLRSEWERYERETSVQLQMFLFRTFMCLFVCSQGREQTCPGCV